MLHSSLPYLFTALAYYIISLVILLGAIRVWWMHPVQRTPMLAVHLTPVGTALVLRLLPLLYMLGAFILSCAVEHHLHWLHDVGAVSDVALGAVAVAESVISLTTAGYIIFLSATWGLGKFRAS